MFAELDQVLFIKWTTQLGHQVLGILRTAVECKQPVEIGKDRRAQSASFVTPQRQQALQALGCENQVCTILAQLGQDAFVVGAGDGVKLVDKQADGPASISSQAGLLGYRQRDQVQERTADQRSRAFANDSAGGIDDDDGAIAEPRGRLNSRCRLANDVARGSAAFETVDLAQDWINHLQLQPAFEGVKVVGPPRVNDRVFHGAQKLAAEHRV